MRDIIARVAAGTTTVQDAHELERVFEVVDMRDIIERVATGATTVNYPRLKSGACPCTTQTGGPDAVPRL